MEVENQVVETPTASAVETPVAVTESAGSPAPSEVALGEEGQAPVVVPPAYQPNMTFRVRDPSTGRQVEKKFDEWLAPIVKTAEDEKKVREILERSHGLDAVKSDRERLFNENAQFKQQIQQQFQPVLEAVQQIEHFKQQGNLAAVFKLAGIPAQEVFKWAYNFANSSPEARQQMEDGNNRAMEAYGAQHQMSQAQQQSVQQAADFKTREFGLIAQYNPQVSSAIDDFDGQHGAGSFFDQVKRVGLYHYQTQGIDIPVDQAINEVLKVIGRATPAQSQPHMQQQVPGQGFAQQQSAPLQAPAKKPVIPNIQGSGSSPAKRVYSSMADIQKRKRELEAEEMNG